MNSNIIKFRIRCHIKMSQPRIMKTHAFTTAGGVVSGDIKFNVGSDLIRSLGCNALSAGKKLHCCWGETKLC